MKISTLEIDYNDKKDCLNGCYGYSIWHTFLVYVPIASLCMNLFGLNTIIL